MIEIATKEDGSVRGHPLLLSVTGKRMLCPSKLLEKLMQRSDIFLQMQG